MSNSSSLSSTQNALGSPREREYVFEERDFNDLRQRVKALTGINLGESKRELVYGRLSRRLRALGLQTFGEYRRLLENADSPELVEFCNALTTNLTAFFREAHHFSHLSTALLAARAADPRMGRRIRIWSAACSSGEEPYSIAMTVCETLRDIDKWDIKILATDVDSNMVATAKRGIYRPDRLKGLDVGRKERFFREIKDEGRPAFETTSEIRNLITFRQINLMHELPMSGPLDAIFCRNVVIYFDKETQREVFARLARLQQESHLLYLGHSESLFSVSEDYCLIGKTIYERRDG